MNEHASAKVTVGIIGAGRIGSIHAEHLTQRIPAAQVLAISDIRLEAAQRCASACGIPEVSADSQTIFDNADIEAVVICSSTDTHADLMIQAAAAGKHIFCEKPIDLSLERIDAALKAVEDAGVKLMVGFNRRFDHNFRRIRDLVREGSIGTPHIFHIISRDPSPPPIDYIKVSGGIFLDMTVHDFDMARYLMDCEMEEMFVAGGVMVDPAIGAAGDLDTAVIVMRFENGAIGTIDNSRQAIYGYDQRVEVFGSKGAACTENDYPNRVQILNAASVRQDLPLNFFIDRYIQAYIDEMREFITCVAEDQTPSVTGRDGRAAILMGYAAKRSYDEHRPVTFKEIVS